jgi:hypothetical protein
VVKILTVSKCFGFLHLLFLSVLECVGGGTKGLQAMRMMFQHLGANVIAREILTTY